MKGRAHLGAVISIICHTKRERKRLLFKFGKLKKNINFGKFTKLSIETSLKDIFCARETSIDGKVCSLSNNFVLVSKWSKVCFDLLKQNFVSRLK
jgi:hypothetical protein